jgi:hypothetical protein
MRIKDFAREVHQNAVDKGFYDNEVLNVDQKLLLSVGELIEAQEEVRSGHEVTEVYYREKDGKPEGFGMELADAVIRIFDLAEACDLNIESLMLEKHAFNTGRPYKHGREF